VADFFGLPVKVEEFVGEWLALPQEARWRLGCSGVLGQSTVTGARTWQRQSKFRMSSDLSTQDDFDSLLPGNQAKAPCRPGAELRWRFAELGPAPSS